MKMENSITWNNSGSAKSIKDALAEIKDGRDIGWEGTKAVMPKYDDFHHWMHFAFLLTSIHNRDCSPKKYSIIRNESDLLQFKNSDFGGGGRSFCPIIGFYFRYSAYH